MVGHHHPGLLEGVQHRHVQLDQRPVPPQRPLRRAVQAQPVRDHRQQVVAVGVGEVPRADLHPHVPAVERRRRIAHPADLQRHVADSRHRVPAQAELREPRVVRVPQRHLHDAALRQLVPLRPRVRTLPHHQRQYLEGVVGPLPAQLAGERGRLRTARIADPVPLRGAVPRVAHQLVVDDPGPGTARPVRCEDRDHRPDPAVVPREAQMLEAGPGDPVGRGDVPQVAHHEAAPVEPADAAGRVAPRDTGAERQLLRGVRVRARPVDLGEHLADPALRVTRPRLLLVELPDEALRLPPVGGARRRLRRSWGPLRAGGGVGRERTDADGGRLPSETQTEDQGVPSWPP